MQRGICKSLLTSALTLILVPFVAVPYFPLFPLFPDACGVPLTSWSPGKISASISLLRPAANAQGAMIHRMNNDTRFVGNLRGRDARALFVNPVSGFVWFKLKANKSNLEENPDK